VTQVLLEDLDKHLRLAKKRAPEFSVFAFRQETTRDLPAHRDVDGVRWKIVMAPSNLAIRAAVLGRADDECLAIITPLETTELGYDLRARIAENKLLVFDPWESVLPLFQATGVDARLRRQHALGQALLRTSNTAQFAPARTDVLSEEEAWAAVFEHALGVGTEPTTVAEWVSWLLDYPSDAATFLLSGSDLVEHVQSRAHARCGPGAAALFAAIHQAIKERVAIDTRVVGLAHAFATAERAKREGIFSTLVPVFKTRLEKYFGPDRPSEAAITAFALDTTRVLLEHEQELAVVTVLDDLFQREDSLPLAVLSDFSRSGYQLRLKHLADAIDDRLNQMKSEFELKRVLDSVKAHHAFAVQSIEGGRIMALARLANRLAQTDTVHDQSAEDIARHYISDGAYEDWLREMLESADMGKVLNPITRRVLDAADSASELRNQIFATALSEIIAEEALKKDAFFVQEMTDRVLAPLASKHPVLLLVLDGLSWFVWREISEDSRLKEWLHFTPACEERLAPMFAALPSVTHFSRTSLLTGRLQKGSQHTEKVEFEKQPRLRGAIGSKASVALFHKGELDANGRGQVGTHVESAILDSKNRVVGVVLNGIDDMLAGSSQVDVRWNLDTLAPLKSLLALAQESNRVVLIVSDHGFVWESGSMRDVGAESARYRLPGEPGSGEVLVRGNMIDTYGEANGLILAASEKVRYTNNKRGYHGGISVQEVVAPCVVLVPEAMRLDLPNFRNSGHTLPGWWNFKPNEDVVHIDAVSEASAQKQLPLIPVAKPVAPKWIDALISHELIQRQMKRLASAPNADTTRAMLLTLAANKGRASVNTVAESLGKSVQSAHRAIPALQAVINVDGFAILQYDRNQELVKLDYGLIKQQFNVDCE
jgi:hypothetical protein